jgi:hypothetical protein
LAASRGSAQPYYPGGYPGTTGGFGGYGGYGGYGGFGGNRGSPISPYLNLLGGGGNPATNFYNFVRPFTGPAARLGMPVGAGMGMGRQTFFPIVGQPEDIEFERQRIEKEDDKNVLRLPPTGHAATFQNTLGYFGTTTGGIGRPAQTGAPIRRR